MNAHTTPQTVTGWCFDMTKAPRGTETERKVEKLVKGEMTEVTRIDYTPDRVWIAANDGVVYATYWVRETKHMAAHWSGLTVNQPGMAWMKYEKPIHPNLLK